MKTTMTHLKALTNTISLGLEAAIVALAADIIWLGHDVLANGMSFVYGTVGTGLVLGLILTIIALVKHDQECMARGHKGSKFLRKINK